jgi:DNA-binding NarL/FixJ family response regulator
VLRTLRRANSSVRMRRILTTFDLDEYVYSALRARASGFLLKGISPPELLTGVRLVAAGEALLAPRVTRRLIAEFARRPERRQARPQALERLTERELEVLTLVAEGLSNAEVAARLMVSPPPRRPTLATCSPKLQARDRTQLVVIAYENGVVAPGG